MPQTGYRRVKRHVKAGKFDGEKSHRDTYDWLMFMIGALGVIGIVAGIWVTLWINGQNSEDTGAAINQMASIANSMAGEQSVLAEQANATVAAARATSNSAAATQLQASASGKQADAANRQAGAAVLASKANDRLARSGADQVRALLDSDRSWAATTLPQASEPVADQEWVITVPVVNTGRSPALRAQTFMLPTIIEKNRSYNFKPIPRCVGVCQYITILPGNNSSFTEVVPKEIMTKDYVDRLNDNTPAIIIQTSIIYYDNIGHVHESFGCYYFVKRIHFTNCSVQNDAT